MKQFFYPSSIAVIGVSTSPDNLGRNIVSNLVEFQFNGRFFAVGPKGGILFGQRIYTEIGQIDAEIDLAVILTPALTVVDLLRQCGEKGIKRVVIESGGFREFAKDRAPLEKELLEVAERYGIRFIGPNGIGNINMENGLCLPFMVMHRDMRPGHISILAQSGGVGLSYMGFLSSENIGINKFVSMGNKLNVNENDLLEFLIQDPGTEVICLYLEGITDGRRMMEIISRSSKPIIIHKSNIGPVSAQIAFSHTAALLSDNKVVEASLKQAGAIRVHDFEEAINYLKILTLPRLKGNRLAVVSRSGGHAVVAADSCSKYGFVLPAFPQAFFAEIEKHFRASVIKLSNPLDLGDLFDLPVYVQIVEETIQREDIDGLILIHVYRAEGEREGSRKLIQKSEELSQRYQKPVAVCIFSEDWELAYIKKHLTMPIFLSPEKATQALHLSLRFSRQKVQGLKSDDPAEALNRTGVSRIFALAAAEERPLNLFEGLEVLSHYGFPVIPFAKAQSLEETLEKGQELGYPLSLKLAIPYIAHKFDVGGVILHITNQEALAAAYYQLREVAQRELGELDHFTVVLQKMSPKGREIILGGKQDPTFGPVMLFGIGGIYVEVIGDVVLRVAPLNRVEARNMIHEIKGIKLLQGVRGQRPSDLEAVIETLMSLSRLLVDFPEIAEIDINPIMVYETGQGCQVLDVRLVLKK
ncbi:MAG: acetate--CoA ligase family protein [Pseudomonadota bacterium]